MDELTKDYIILNQFTKDSNQEVKVENDPISLSKELQKLMLKYLLIYRKRLLISACCFRYMYSIYKRSICKSKTCPYKQTFTVVYAF